MKTRIYIYTKFTLLLGLAMLTATSCEREISDEAVPATFNSSGEIFTDSPVGLTDDFFVSFDPNVGANTEGFGTDDNVSYEGSTSIRIDVPAADDPSGGFIGCLLYTSPSPRDRG